MHIICRVGIHCICSTASWIGESCRGPNNITDFYFASCAFKQPRSLEDQYMVKPPSGQCLRTKSAHMYTLCKLPDSSWLFSLIVWFLVTGVRSCSSLSFLVLTPQRWVSGISRPKRWSRVSAFQSFDTVGVFNTACIYVIWAIWVTLEIIALGNVLLFSGIERLVRWLFYKKMCFCYSVLFLFIVRVRLATVEETRSDVWKCSWRMWIYRWMGPWLS